MNSRMLTVAAALTVAGLIGAGSAAAAPGTVSGAGGNRIGTVRSNGDAHVKEGGLSAIWTLESSDIKQIALSGDRIGVLKGNGDAYVKDGGLTAAWVKEASNVKQIALSGNRIGVLKDNGNAFVKDGGLTAGWVHEAAKVKELELSGDRIGIVQGNGDAFVKDGGLSAVGSTRATTSSTSTWRATGSGCSRATAGRT